MILLLIYLHRIPETLVDILLHMYAVLYNLCTAITALTFVMLITLQVKPVTHLCDSTQHLQLIQYIQSTCVHMCPS